MIAPRLGNFNRTHMMVSHVGMRGIAFIDNAERYNKSKSKSEYSMNLDMNISMNTYNIKYICTQCYMCDSDGHPNNSYHPLYVSWNSVKFVPYSMGVPDGYLPKPIRKGNSSINHGDLAGMEMSCEADDRAVFIVNVFLNASGDIFNELGLPACNFSHSH